MLDSLKACYTIFDEIVATRGVRWMIHSNMVIADEVAWSKLLKGVLTTTETSQPQYYLVATIFGLTGVDIDDETMIVIPSDTTESVGNSHGPIAASPTDLDKVNSPCVRRGPNVKRKLFIDESGTADRHSSKAAPPINLGTTFDCP
ncbi:hypothetical protein SASPL_130971 [Salvia splendens]|uniref:Uncharacterized protein n=1 Tax=Salvia splendens TaxID=180675 RepID=A0A8X8X552_SALSN|nr:hypothetical protein SASPL_130971 [Salvia splendens]